MKSVFVDTAALIALGNRRDDFHGPARTVRRTLIRGGYAFVTTRLVIVELCNAFSRGELRSTAARIVDSIEQSSRWTIIEADRPWITAGFDLYRRMTDKEWGLVDCVSILVAQHFEIQDVFTTDHHFEQAGFRILLQRTT